MMRLVTTWFGSFVVDGSGKVLEHSIFPKDANEISERISMIEKGEILPEEEELAAGRELCVREKRLELLGEFSSFEQPDILPQDHGFEPQLLSQAMIRLGKEKMRRGGTPDEQIMQAIRAMNDLTKIINLMSERLREWHSINFPELVKLVSEKRYIELIAEYGDRESILASGKVDFQDSMGSDIAKEDSDIIKQLAGALLDLEMKRGEIEAYVQERMKEIAPNTSHLAGPLIGARLISLAGGLKRLSRFPSSTVQLLGAEKALFKHIRDKAKPPKHGVIFQHPLIHRAPTWQRGKIARVFASKTVIAIKMDTYGERFIGEELEKDLMKRVEEIRRKYPNPPKKGKNRQ